MDFIHLPNPYDFANPVNNPYLFVGRDAEIDEIKYYLEHASKAARPINLAIIGERASGKTSFLNMIEIEAKKRDFCVVRVDLDESDAETQLAFFYKIFDSILTEACNIGAYGGIKGKTYETYCDIVSTYDIPSDNIFCPFIFPIRYAKAMSRNNTSIALPDNNFKRDIISIQQELKRPIAILFDECDVLTHSRVHLQKLRNIFMNTPGFMLTITGTPVLFPIIDEVFSPIIRQFKKINIVPFDEEVDTEVCIKRPLENIGITEPSVLFDFETYHDVNEIHNLTGGRPYEIQLLCHFLFRRVQEKQAEQMKLTLEVLEDVLSELRTLQDVSARPIVNIIKNLDKKQLEALGILCSCNGNATFEQIWFNEYVFQKEYKWTKQSLFEQLSTFIELGVLTIEDEIIRFCGDDFDRIYCKYFSKTHKIDVYIQNMPFSFLIAANLGGYLRDDPVDDIFLSSSVQTGKIEKIDIRNLAEELSNLSSDKDPFSISPEIAEELYWAYIESLDLDKESFQAGIISIITPWATSRQWFRCYDKDSSCKVNEIIQHLEIPARRAREFNGDLQVEIYILPVIPIDILSIKVKQTKNIKLKRKLSALHYNEMINAYLEDKDVENACFHGELAYSYNSEIITNNLGYLYLVSGKYERAYELFEEALKNNKDIPDIIIPSYNLAIIAAKKGNFEDAISRFQIVSAQTKDLGMIERKCACLLIPELSENEKELYFKEVNNPDLLDASLLAISIIKRFLEK